PKRRVTVCDASPRDVDGGACLAEPDGNPFSGSPGCACYHRDHCSVSLSATNSVEPVPRGSLVGISLPSVLGFGCSPPVLSHSCHPIVLPIGECFARFPIRRGSI